MKAAAFSEYGKDPQYTDVLKPPMPSTAGAAQGNNVLIKIDSSSINPIDWKVNV